MRLRPGCTPSDAQPVAVEVARWPALLEPWIDGAMRSEVETLPWSAACAASVAPSRALRVTGLDDGSVIRPAPGHRSAVLAVQAIGAREGVTWLLDGLFVGSAGTGGAPLRLTLDQPGEHALTAIDGQGRYERVGFGVR